MYTLDPTGIYVSGATKAGEASKLIPYADHQGQS